MTALDDLAAKLWPALSYYLYDRASARDLGRGTAFPTTPPFGLQAGDRFFRTDLLAFYVWDGSEWLVLASASGLTTLAYGHINYDQTFNTNPQTIDFDVTEYDSSGAIVVTTGSSWRCLLPHLGWYIVWCAVDVKKDSTDINIGEWWRLDARPGANGSTNGTGGGATWFVAKYVWPCAVAAGDLNAAGAETRLMGVTFVNVITAPADFYFTLERGDFTNDRHIESGHWFVGELS